MGISATTANSISQTSLSKINTDKVVGEVDKMERAIMNASGRGQFYALLNAKVIGNPSADPSQTEELSGLQRVFRDVFVTRGYTMTIDGNTGYWKAVWETQVMDVIPQVYSIRTTVTPGALVTQTITTINTLFAELSPPVSVTSKLVESLEDPYEYTIIVNQLDQSVSYVDEITTALVTSGLGYTMENTTVVKAY